MADNPFVDFKNRYAGQDAIADKIGTNALAKMQRAYIEAYNAIYVWLNKARQDVDYCSYAKQTQLMKHIGAELDGMKTKGGSYLGKALKEVAAYAAKVAINDLAVIGANEVTKASSWHRKYNVQYAEQVHKDNFTHIAAQTTRMRHQAKQLLRSDAARVLRYAAVSGMTRKEAYYALKDEVLGRDPTFQFVDKAGKRWKTESYFEMLTRTVMHNTLRECYANTLIQEGHDLVKVTIQGAKDACRKWEGKVLSLTGATNGYPTVDQARATGEVFHPRCRHRLVAYHKSIDDVFKAVEDGKTDEEILGSD